MEKRARGGNSWVEINWEDLMKSGCSAAVGRVAGSPSILLPHPAHCLMLVYVTSSPQDTPPQSRKLDKIFVTMNPESFLSGRSKFIYSNNRV